MPPLLEAEAAVNKAPGTTFIGMIHAWFLQSMAGLGAFKPCGRSLHPSSGSAQGQANRPLHIA